MMKNQSCLQREFITLQYFSLTFPKTESSALRLDREIGGMLFTPPLLFLSLHAVSELWPIQWPFPIGGGQDSSDASHPCCFPVWDELNSRNNRSKSQWQKSTSLPPLEPYSHRHSAHSPREQQKGPLGCAVSG